MARRKIPPTSGDKSYAVGYGKPPVHTRFQPGQSGNPAGRRKGVRNLKTDVKRALAKPIKVKQGGRTCTRSTQEAAVIVLVEKALRGDPRALEQFLDLAQRFNNDLPDASAAQPLPADDQAILDFYAAERAATVGTTAASAPSTSPTSDPRGRSRKRRRP